MRQGLNKIGPRRKDYSLLHTFGDIVPDPKGLPGDFSIYDGRPIPNQNDFDTRFSPNIRPLPEGCVAEATTYLAGLEDNALYPPDDFYFAIPPGTDGVGRDVRNGLATAKNRGFKLLDGTIGAKKGDYYNCYGVGAIDDFDAVRIALWINQTEKRAVTIGTWFYSEFVFPAAGSGTGSNHPNATGIAPVPSFVMGQAALHNWIVTGWKTIDGILYLEALTWQGQRIEYFSREVYNALLAQPWTGAFTLAKTPVTGPIPIGMTAIVDHLVYYIRSLFHV